MDFVLKEILEIVENSPDSIFVHNLRGQIVYANNSVHQTYGYSNNELLSMTVMDIDSQYTDLDLCKDVWNRLKHEPTIEFSSIHKKKNAATFPVVISLRLLSKNKPDFILAYIQDSTLTTERESRYKLLSDLNQEGIVIHEKGVVLEANKSFCEMFGYSPNELINKQCVELLFTPESAKIMRKNHSLGITYTYEYMGIRKDGKQIQIETDARNFNYKGRNVRIATVRDITEKRKLEKKLRRMESTFLEFMDISHDNILYWQCPGQLKTDLPANRQISMLLKSTCLNTNPRALEALGYKKESALIGLTFQEIFSKALISRALKEFIERNYHLVDFELTEKKPDGTDFYSLLNIYGVVEDDKLSFIWTSEKNISSLISIKNELLRSESLLEDVEALNKSGAWEYTVSTAEMFWTKGLYRLHGVTTDPHIDHINKSIHCYYQQDQKVIMELFQKCLDEGTPYDREFPFVTYQGEHIWIRTKTQPVYQDEKVIKVIGSVTNISARKRLEQKLKNQATHDQLTKTPNRYFLHENYNKWKTPLEEKGHCLVYLDLDNFKTINDYYGHTTGDRILVEVAGRFSLLCGPDTMMIRYGGDEFIFLLPFTDNAKVDSFIKNCINSLNQSIHIKANEFKVKGSFGVAFSGGPKSTLHDLLSQADFAMYQAKVNHLGYAIFSENMYKENEYRLTIEKELEKALEKKEFHIEYQPQVSSINAEVIGIEALLRWNNKLLGDVAPDKFIGIAESMGIIHTLGQFVINRSFKDLRAIQKKHPDIRLSINVSVKQLLDEGFRKFLNEKAFEYEIKPSKIALEITESIFIEDINFVSDLLYEMQKDGFVISLDDFGTGYSALSILAKLPINEVKLDKSFIKGMNSDQNIKALINGILKIGHDLKIGTLAEGVENKEEIDYLQSVGCEMFQGFFYSRPLNFPDLMLYIENSLHSKQIS